MPPTHQIASGDNFKPGFVNKFRIGEVTEWHWIANCCHFKRMFVEETRNIADGRNKALNKLKSVAHDPFIKLAAVPAQVLGHKNRP